MICASLAVKEVKMPAKLLDQQLVEYEISLSKAKDDHYATFHTLPIRISPEDTYESVLERFEEVWNAQSVLPYNSPYFELEEVVEEILEIARERDKNVETAFNRVRLQASKDASKDYLIGYYRGYIAGRNGCK